MRIKSGPLTASRAASAAGSQWSGSAAAAPGKGWAKLRSEARRGGENASNALRVTSATYILRACVKDVAVTTKGWCLFERVVTHTAAYRLTETNDKQGHVSWSHTLQYVKTFCEQRRPCQDCRRQVPGVRTVHRTKFCRALIYRGRCVEVISFCRRFLTSPFCCTTKHLSRRPSPPRFVHCDADVSPAAPLSCFSGHEPLSKPLPIPLSLQVVKMQTTVEQQLQALAAIQRLLSLSPNPPDGRKDRDSELSGLV